MYLSCGQNSEPAEGALAYQVSRCPSNELFIGILTFMRDLRKSKQERRINKIYQ